MRRASVFVVAILVSLAVFLLQTSGTQAAFHCNRIYAVMGGFSGKPAIQFVEIRATAGSENFVSGHKIRFYNASGTLKATFTFPSSVANGFNGDSILIATKEFNNFTAGGAADFIFSDGSPGYPPSNTVGSSGGDPLHPVQSPGGRVVFGGDPGDFNCNLVPSVTIVDSLAYGGAPADAGFVTQTASLPSPSDNRALRLGTLTPKPSGSATEYALQTVSASTFSVLTTDLKSNTSIPRNNGRTVLLLAAGIGGIAEQPEVNRAPAQAPASSGMGAGTMAAIATGAAMALVLVLGAGLLVTVTKRRRVR